MQTTPEGHPQFACLAPLPFTTDAVAAWAAKSLATSATVVSDGLWCFRAVKLIGAEHAPTVTGGGAASTKLPQFKAGNTLLGNLKTALAGTYHAFDFAKYAHRYLAEVQYRFNRRFNLASILALWRPISARCARPAAMRDQKRVSQVEPGRNGREWVSECAVTRFWQKSAVAVTYWCQSTNARLA